MGWSTTYKPRHIKATDYLLHHSGALTWGPDSPGQYRVLDTAIVNLKTFYAAVERIDKATGAREVWAAVFLLGYWRSGNENFGWKSMDETMGPCEAQCPERILDLLTPTESDYANDWRARCRAYHAARRARPKIVPGAVVTLYGKEYKVSERRGRGWMVYRDGCPYKLTDVKARQCTSIQLPQGASA